jgi:hypothetical protein
VVLIEYLGGRVIACYVHYAVGVEVGKGQTGIAEVVSDTVLVLPVGSYGRDAPLRVVDGL